MKQYYYLVIVILFPHHLFSQFAAQNNIPFYNGGFEMSMPLAGGMNAPQFSETDFNGDGRKDLFIYERATMHAITLINQGDGVYTFAPQYQDIFPELGDWVLLRD